MARLYIFFQPQRLPLAPEDLADDTVLPLTDAAAARVALSRVLPDIVWEGERGRGEYLGDWLEFQLPAGELTLSLRCSLRADHEPLVQRLCDELGWLAFDEAPLCFQPHRPPMQA